MLAMLGVAASGDTCAWLRVAPDALLLSAARDGRVTVRAMGEGCLRRGLRARGCPFMLLPSSGVPELAWRAFAEVPISAGAVGVLVPRPFEASRASQS
jgi:hypothetical protein